MLASLMRKGLLIAVVLLCCKSAIYAQPLPKTVVNSTNTSLSSSVNIDQSTSLTDVNYSVLEIQKDEKGKFIEIYDSPFLAHSEKIISTKLMNNKKVKDVIVNKSAKTITIYFSKDLSNAEINDFARIYFNK